MGRVLLALFVSGLVSAAWAQPSLAAPAEQKVLIRDGFVVPTGKQLQVDDISGTLSEVTPPMTTSTSSASK